MFETTYMCLKMGFMSNRVWGFMMQCQLRQRAFSDMTDNSTSSKVLALDDKALRSTGANAVVITMLLLGDPYSRRLLACIVQAGLYVQTRYFSNIWPLKVTQKASRMVAENDTKNNSPFNACQPTN